MMRWMMLATLAACAAPLPEDLATTLDDRGGCADVVFYAVDVDDSVMLTVRGSGLIAAAQAGAEQPFVFDLPSEDLTVTLEQGDRVSDAMCDDVIENGGPTVVRTWTPSSGTATITVRVDATADAEPEADLRLDDVILESNGDTATVDEMEILGVTVGWFAG